MALLSLVNALRDLLRENQVSSVATASPDLLVQIGLINRAARRLLARRQWSFLHRQDGYLFFPASLVTTVNAFGAIPAVQPNMSAAAINTFANGSLQVKIQIDGDPAFPRSSFIMSDMTAGGLFNTADIPIAYPGTIGGPYTCTIYSNEQALPPYVSNLLSIRNEENFPIRFETIDTFDDFERLIPRDALRFSQFPEVVAVGGQIVPTTNKKVKTTPGIGVWIWPPPNKNVLLRYSYVLSPPVLANDTDQLIGVPQEVQDLVVNTALEEALSSNIENDPQRAQVVRTQNEADYMQLSMSDRRDRGRRHIPQPFGLGYSHYGWRFDKIPPPQ